MSVRRRFTALLAVLLIAAVALPGVASAMPIDPPGSGIAGAEPPAPVPTVVRTVVREEAVRMLPIALAGAALLVALAGTGYVLLRVPPTRHRLGTGH